MEKGHHGNSRVPSYPLFDSLSTTNYLGIADCFLKIYKTDGLIGLYRGFFVSIQGIFVYRAAYFGLFDMAKILFATEEKHLHFFSAWAIAQVRSSLSISIEHGIYR